MSNLSDLGGKYAQQARSLHVESDGWIRGHHVPGAIAGAIGWTAIMLVALEVRQRRADELAEFRRTIEALKRISHEEGDA